MLITSNRMQEGVKATVDGQALKVLHVENVTDILEHNYVARKEAENGFSKERHFRQIFCLSTIAYLRIAQKYPEIRARDMLVRKAAWQRVAADPEFDVYKTVRKGI